MQPVNSAVRNINYPYWSSAFVWTTSFQTAQHCVIEISARITVGEAGCIILSHLHYTMMHRLPSPYVPRSSDLPTFRELPPPSPHHSAYAVLHHQHRTSRYLLVSARQTMPDQHCNHCLVKRAALRPTYIYLPLPAGNRFDTPLPREPEPRAPSGRGGPPQEATGRRQEKSGACSTRCEQGSARCCR